MRLLADRAAHLAHMAQDENLLDAFRRDGRSSRDRGDLRRHSGDGRRGAARASEDDQLRGDLRHGPVNLGRSLNITTKEAARWIDAYFARSHGIRAFIERTKEAARRDLYVETLAGRRRPVPEVASPDHRTLVRRAHRGEHADPRNRRRHSQDRDDPRSPRASFARACARK